jgi:hypothetical protein
MISPSKNSFLHANELKLNRTDECEMTKLPGIYFKAKSRATENSIPRTDIAAFAGFASCGPVGIPVAVESIATFTDIFGPDLDIAWEPKDGSFQAALLGPAVRLFFYNGGARCYVVRLAGSSGDALTAAPTTQTFGLPGILRCNARRNTTSARAPARCPGSWADFLKVIPIVNVEGIALDFNGKKNDGSLLLQTRPSPMVSRGDLLRLCFLDSDQAEIQEFFSILEINADASVIVPGTTVCLKNLSITDIPSALLLPSQDCKTRRCRCLSWSGQPADGQLPVLTVKKHHEAFLPQPGMVLPVHLRSGKTAIVEVDHCLSEQDFNSPPEEVIDIAVRRSWEIVQRPNDFFTKSRFQRAQRITLSIRVNDYSGSSWSIENLGLCPLHARPWMDLPSDDEMFLPPDSSIPPAQTKSNKTLLIETAQPRFPLAGPMTTVDNFYIPIGLLDSVLEAHGAPLGDTDPKSRIERDGLARFDASLFLDARLADESIYTLYETAKGLRYCSAPESSDGLRREPLLKGIHSFFFIEEISLLAAPDALLTGWTREALPGTSMGRKADRDRFLDAPDITIASIDQNGAIIVTPGVPGASSYMLADGEDVDFEGTVIHTPMSSGGDPATFILKPDETCSRLHYIKIQAIAKGRVSLWSKTIVLALPISVFTEDAVTAAKAPDLHGYPSSSAGTIRLTWSAIGNAQTYRLQRSVDPEFSTAESTELIQCEMITEIQTGTLFRVQAIIDETGGPWSSTLAPAVFGESSVRMRSPEEYDTPGDLFGKADLIRIHKAMLRMCASRSDFFTIAGLPRHFAAAPANNYLLELTNDLSRSDEARAVSYGAIYSPWIVLSDGTIASPDGAMAGIVAKTSQTTGPWRAPANIIVQNSASLFSLSNNLFQETDTGRGVNLLREGPYGITAWSCRTLSETQEPTLINGRMLLILVRRLATREGSSVIFQNNGPALQEYLEYRFNRILSDLFALGAFAGATESEGFQVKVSALPENALQSSFDNGRLFVELRVAPSMPMEYLTVAFSILENEPLQLMEI